MLVLTKQSSEILQVIPENGFLRIEFQSTGEQFPFVVSLDTNEEFNVCNL